MKFDDASSQFLRKSASMGAISGSFWFNPDDLTIDQTMWCQSNVAGTAYFQVQLLGSTGADKVMVSYSTAGVPSQATSLAAANANAWNHVYFAIGLTTVRAYVSLNGEALQNGITAGSSGTPNTTQMGRRPNGLGVFNQYYSGQIAEFGAWNNCLNDFDDRWKALYRGTPVWDIPIDPNGTFGLGVLSLISDTELMGNIVDRASGAATWTTTSSPTKAADHPRIRR